MKLEQQVCSLELAKRLKELGVKQESIYWYATNAPASVLFDGEGKRDQMIMESWTERDFCSAFTVAELGEMLEQNEPLAKRFESTHVINEWQCYFVERYEDDVNGGGRIENREAECVADTEADARGKMLVYLLENKLIAV